MAKSISGYIKLQIPAAGATPAPPVGPALGQKGLKIQDFCKAFNDATANEEKGTPLPVVITCYDDKTFSFIVKKAPASSMILKELGIPKGSAVPHKNKVGTLTMEQVRKIAQDKMVDLNADSVEAAMRIIQGTARSMGVVVE